jgi:hypothetical protein
MWFCHSFAREEPGSPREAVVHKIAILAMPETLIDGVQPEWTELLHTRSYNASVASRAALRARGFRTGQPLAGASGVGRRVSKSRHRARTLANNQVGCTASLHGMPRQKRLEQEVQQQNTVEVFHDSAQGKRG